MLDDGKDSITWHPYEAPQALLTSEEQRKDLLNYLEKNLFSQSKERTGAAKTFLNINCFRELLEVVKLTLTEDEQSSLIDYNLQVLMIELAQIKTSQTSVDDVIRTILYELRKSAHYWIEGSSIYEEIRDQSMLVLK